MTFNVNGIFYNRTSHANGLAYLNINLDAGSYVITATNNKGLSVANTINIAKSDAAIKGKSTNIIYGVDKNYTVTLVGTNNKTVNSAPVIFKYANRTVTAITDNEGKATITISGLPEGTFTISYSFDGNVNYKACKSSSKLVVSNSTVVLTAKDLKMVYHDGSAFKVKLTDTFKNPLANETITFTINGVSYNHTTNKDGVASLTIKLNPGNYSIFYSHSNIDSPDYNEGTRMVYVSKLPATLSAKDLVMKPGEKASFSATLTNSSGSPVPNTVVTFKINNVEYNRTTNKKGVASLNIALGVGYYTITTSLDNLFYQAKTITNHVLVNGTVFIAQDLNMVVGKASNFSVTLNDAYGKPVSNAPIKFTYSSVTKTVNTNSKGIASITINNLPKGDYPIVYNYTKGDNSGMSYIHVAGTIPIKDLVAAANTLNTYIERNAKLPSSITIGGESYSTAQYLYLLSEAIVNIGNNDLSNLYVSDVKNPSNPGAASNMGVLKDYSSVASSLLTQMSSGTAPNSVSTSIGTVGYDGIVYAFTRVMVYYGEMNKLPASVAVKSLKIYESQSVLDSKNTISNLAPYLAASTHCDVNNAKIVALAEKLTEGLTNSYDKAVAIYNYVRDEIDYSFYYDTWHGSVGTLDYGSGNCVDQAHLLIALYRAADLPARYGHGTCSFNSGTYGHVWAQVLLGDTWVVSDPTSTRNSFGKVINWNNYNYQLKGYYSSISF